MEKPFTNAEFAFAVSTISRKSTIFAHELVYGMGNPNYCSALPGRHELLAFLEEIEPALDPIRVAASLAPSPQGERP